MVDDSKKLSWHAAGQFTSLRGRQECRLTDVCDVLCDTGQSECDNEPRIGWPRAFKPQMGGVLMGPIRARILHPSLGSGLVL